jgi:hypothetical protein
MGLVVQRDKAPRANSSRTEIERSIEQASRANCPLSA